MSTEFCKIDIEIEMDTIIDTEQYNNRVSMSFIPPPPELKATIIQMQSIDSNDNDELDRKEDNHHQQQQQQSRRKRRRSSASLISQNEIEKRRREHKTAHSIIEKKRRIRMNREFEALKYLIPACRNNFATSNSNGEGMYKLTILQATVDYIRYLHNIINIESTELKESDSRWEDEDLNFASVDVDTDAYRNLNNDYNFSKLFDELTRQAPSATAEKLGSSTRNRSLTGSSIRLGSDQTNDVHSSGFPSPLITPEISPNTVPSSFCSSMLSTPAPSTNPNYKTTTLTKDIVQSNPNGAFTFPKSSSKTSFKLPVPALAARHNSASQLEMIHEASHTNNHETSATHALLAMKKDNNITSIRSLLN